MFSRILQMKNDVLGFCHLSFVVCFGIRGFRIIGMKRAHLRFYEELNDHLPEDKKKRSFVCSFAGELTVATVLKATGVPVSKVFGARTGHTPGIHQRVRHHCCFGAARRMRHHHNHIKLRVNADLLPKPIHSLAEADAELGIQLRVVPASTFVDTYRTMPESPEMMALADQYIRGAKKVVGATRQDVLNGARSYLVARKIMQQEDADGTSMDCLGVLGPTKMSLPCLAWSRMNDDGIPAACEADIGAVASHVLVQYLFDRPGFQVDPVAETSRKAITGAHCSCPTRLNGYDKPAEPYVLRHHHAGRDATADTVWRVGQPVTSIDVLCEQKKEPVRILISSGSVLENVAVPPAGGCVISVMVKFEGVDDVLAYPGFHQIFFYGNYRQQLLEFCRLNKIEPQVA